MIKVKASENSIEFEAFSLLWQHCDNDGDLAERFYVPGYVGYLPFFLSGEDLDKFRNNRKFELREEQLLKAKTLNFLFWLIVYVTVPCVFESKFSSFPSLITLNIMIYAFDRVMSNIFRIQRIFTE